MNRARKVLGVRPAVPRDLSELRGIFRRASLFNDGDRDVLLANPEALELPDAGAIEGRTRVAVSADGTIVGFITGSAVDASALELEDLFVDPGWMRRGVGRRLVADLTATAKHDGITCIRVTANPHAEAFYRSVGFVHVDDVDTQFGPGARMQLAIPSDHNRSA